MPFHDCGRKEVAVTISAPRDKWQREPGTNKVSQIVPMAHLATVAGLSDPEFFGTPNGRITHMTVHHVEGMSTGASLGVVAGHTDNTGKFIPLPTSDTTAHVDMHGDTHVYHAVVSGRTPSGGARTVAFKEPEAHEHVNEAQIKGKVERWKGVDSAGDISVFSAKNTEGKSKSLAAVKTSDPLGKLIERNLGNPKFSTTTGPIRTVENGKEKYYVGDASKFDNLRTGLETALERHPKWSVPPSVKLFTDAEAVKGTGSHPFNADITFSRKDAKQVDYDDLSVQTAALDLDTSGLIGEEEDSLARAVFAEEKGVVSITAGGNDTGGDDN
jgi:hypothetical protein